MKTIIYFSGLLLMCQFLLAQDIIFTFQGNVYEGKVIEITENAIKYKSKNNPDGPTYSVDKSKVSKIKYENGKTEIINITNETYNTTSNETEEDKIFDSIIRKKKNIVGFDVAQFVYVSAGMSYERFFGKYSQFSIRIPFSVGFNYIGNEDNLIIDDVKSYNYYATPSANYYIYANGKIAGFTIEFNYYPFNMKRMNYYVGPYFEYGVFAYKVRQVYSFYNQYGYQQYETRVSPLRYDGQHLAGGIMNGFLYHFNQVFTLEGTFGLGLKKDETVISGDRVLTQARFNFIFGIKF